MRFSLRFLCRAVVVALVVALSAAMATATTVPAGSMQVRQAVPTRTVCHWSVYAGGLYVTGSDAFPDVCHCGAYCHAYATDPFPRGKTRGARHLRHTDQDWSVTLGGLSPPNGIHRGQRIDFFASLAPCGWSCERGLGRRARPKNPTKILSATAVPLPAGFWFLFAAVLCLMRSRAGTAGVAHPARAVVRRT